MISSVLQGRLQQIELERTAGVHMMTASTSPTSAIDEQLLPVWLAWQKKCEMLIYPLFARAVCSETGTLIVHAFTNKIINAPISGNAFFGF